MGQCRNFLQIAVVIVVTLLSLTGCGGSGNPTPVGGGQQPVIALDAQPPTINQGQSTTISWQATNATSFSLSPSVLPAGQTYPMSGSATVSPASTTTYTATASDASGHTVTSTITVTVVPANTTPTITLSLTPSVIGPGQTTSIAWQSTNATKVVISPSVLGEDTTALDLSGSGTIVPTGTTTYTATATGAGGATATTTATVSVMTVSLTASPATISAGQSATLSWNSQNAPAGTTFSIDQSIGAVNGPSGSLTVTPAATTTYTITATS